MSMTPEEAVRAALLRVAENVAKHVIGRSGWHPGDECFEVDLRAAEAELLAAVRGAVAIERQRCAALADRHIPPPEDA
jgi:hypothetical protein